MNNVLYLGYDSFYLTIAISDGTILFDEHNGTSVELNKPFIFSIFEDHIFSSLVGKTICAFQYLSPIEHDYVYYGIILHFISGEKLFYYENDSEEMIIELSDGLPVGLIAHLATPTRKPE